MADKIQLEVVTPERRVLAEPVDMVTVPGLGGELGILPGHTPLISQLQTGVLTYVQDGKSFPLTCPADLSKCATILSRCWRKSPNVRKRSTRRARSYRVNVSRSSSMRGVERRRTSRWRGLSSNVRWCGYSSLLPGNTRQRGFIAARMSLTAASNPENSARATMLWPILNSMICSISATGPTFRYVKP